MCFSSGLDLVECFGCDLVVYLGLFWCGDLGALFGYLVSDRLASGGMLDGFLWVLFA